MAVQPAHLTRYRRPDSVYVMSRDDMLRRGGDEFGDDPLNIAGSRWWWAALGL